MPAPSGAQPLVALDAIAVDTETTGLDTQASRIVQVGGVLLRRGRIVDADPFDRLVDPGVAIPAASTAIHGIADADVRGAPAWSAIHADFVRYAGRRVWIGYSIGFDLAVMERECARAGIAFERPRTLCVRLLAALVGPNLPDNSLEMIARWLGVPLEGRHSALGDARAAASIFVALVPRLAERGIRTLAEAERAVLRLTPQLEDQHRAGWSDPVGRPDLYAEREALRGVDPYAYRHRVGDMMSAPPMVARADATLREAIARMTERKVSSLFVSDDGAVDRDVSGYGIVTERDIMRALAASGADAFDRPLGGLATRPLASIRARAFVYRAIGRMDRLRIRHLAVRGEDGRLVGIVSARDLLRLRAAAAISLDDEIETAASGAELAAAWSRLPSIAKGLIGEDIDGRVIAEIVSEELRAMTRRAARLAEARMESEGHGPAPCPYAVMVLGSGGRGESLLAADQDNAIVFASGDPDGPEDRWFAAMAEHMAATLDVAGIPFCKGGVMAKNAQWRGSAATWRARVDDWISRSRPQDLLNVDIFFDLAPVHGDASLATDLLAHAHEAGSAAPGFAKLLGDALGDRPAPFTLFGAIQADQGRIDLKMHGLFPIVTLARTLAIRHRVRERSTRERLLGLASLKIGGDSDLTAMAEGHAFLLGVMLAQQSIDLQSGIPVSNRVEIANLSRDEQARLKRLLRLTHTAPALARDLMFS